MRIKLSVADIEQIKKYEQVRTPDMAFLAELVWKAKGEERTMAKFGEDTGIGASTLSRIVNHNFKKALSIETIIKIFEHRANKEDTMLLEQLVRANGYASPEEILINRNRAAHRGISEDLINRELMMRNSLVATMSSCGLPIEKLSNIRELNTSLSCYLGRNAFEVCIPPYYSDSTFERWIVRLFPRLVEETATGKDSAISFRIFLNEIIRSLSPLFLVDAWTPNELIGYKFSFAILDADLFYPLIDYLQTARLNTEMSLILLDRTNFSVIKEVWLPNKQGIKKSDSIFDTPTQERLYLSDEDTEDESYDNDRYYNTEDTE